MHYCLNCGAPLNGPFCSGCGQRVIPAYPTIREMAGDAWEELSGYDGRFVRTFKLLLRRPGALTLEVLEGRRARYISPVRIYLVASVLYFLAAVISPTLSPPRSAQTTNGGFRIDLSTNDAALLTPEQRKRALEDLESAPWWLAPVLRSALTSPVDFRTRFLANLPRVLFALVPVYAGIVALFYRRRRFLVHLIFALHLHTAVFAALTVAQLSNLSRSVAFASACGLIAFGFIVIYSLLAFRRVYSESWAWTLTKSVAVGVLYLVAGLSGLAVTFAWAALT
jgi:uncharacterized protein DUF3667